MAEAAAAVDAGAGCLFIVRTNEGDVMNFEMAAEIAGREVRTIVTDDDVAVETSTYSTGRRGVAGTLVVEKMVGAAAEPDVIWRRSRRSARTSTRGPARWALRLPRARCRPPASPLSSSARTRWRWASAFTASRGVGASRSPSPMSSQATRAVDSQGSGPKRGTPVLLFVNGFGGTPALELYLMANAVRRVLVLPG